MATTNLGELDYGRIERLLLVAVSVTVSFRLLMMRLAFAAVRSDRVLDKRQLGAGELEIFLGHGGCWW